MLFTTMFLIAAANNPAQKCHEKLEASAVPTSGKPLTTDERSQVAIVFHETGKKLVGEKNLPLATQSFLLSASLDHHYAAPHFALATLYETAGDRACAIVHYQKLIDLESKPAARKAAIAKVRALSRH